MRTRQRAKAATKLQVPTIEELTASPSSHGPRDSTNIDDDHALFERLAAPYKNDPVENLPKKLESQIRDFHSSNAETLIHNKDKLNRSRNQIPDILKNINAEIEIVQKLNRSEKETYDHMKTIDSLNNFNTDTFENRYKVIEILNKISERVRETDNWKALTEQKAIPQNVTDLSQIVKYRDNVLTILEDLEKMSAAINPMNLPPELKDMQVGKEYVERVRNILKNFNFCIEELVGKLMKYALQPGAFEVPEESKELGMSEEASSRLTILPLYPLRKILLWQKRNFPSEYKNIINNHYNLKSIEYFVREVQPRITAAEQKISNMSVNSPSSSDHFVGGENASTSTGKTVLSILEDLIPDIFHSLRVESEILTKFWNVDSSYMSGIIDYLFSPLESLWNAVERIDKFFLARIIGLIQEQQKLVPLDITKLMDSTQKRWKKYCKSQKAVIDNSKAVSRKNKTFSCVKHFPGFVSRMTKRCNDADKTIIDDFLSDLLRYIINWLKETSLMKSQEKKRVKLLLINSFSLTTELKKISFVNKSPKLGPILDELISDQMKNMDKFQETIIYNTWADTFAFFQQIISWKEESGLTQEMISFQPTHTVEQFKILNANLEKKLNENLKKCYQYITKKVEQAELEKRLKEDLPVFAKETWNKWDELALECYNIGLKVRPETVEKEMMNIFMVARS